MRNLSSVAYDPAMWRKPVDRLLTVGTALVLAAWLVASAAIVFGPLGFEFHRGNTGLVFAIFLAPIAGWVVVEELVVHRLKHGPTKPGRHSRAAFDLEQLLKLDERLKRRSDDSSESSS